jgi:hypothetical protein
MTYARSRLWLGISAVGSLVVLAAIGLVFQLPHRLLPNHGPGWTGEAAWLFALLLVYSVVHWPFDYLGGYHLPCHHGRLCQVLPVFVWSSFRATLLQVAILTGGGVAVMHAGRRLGLAGAIAAAGFLMICMVAFQIPLASAIGGLKPAPQGLEIVHGQLRNWTSDLPRTRIVESVDAGFSGGIAGLPFAETIVIPAHWVQQMSPAAVATQLLRRQTLIRSGARLRGLLVAMIWNLSGFALASRMPGAGFESLAAFVTLALWFNLWSFLGLLLLPSLSRPGVLEADAAALANGVPVAVLAETAASVDQLQDDEASRPKWVERIFHPIPSLTARQEAWRQDRAPVGAWHAARLALYLSWPCLGLLGRAVHCNSGRPELWVFLPAD